MTRTGWVLLGSMGLSAMGLSAPAAAADGGAYMWGAGFNLGTSFLPGRYPYAFPGSVAKYDFRENGPLAGDPNADEPDRDLDPVTDDPRFSTLSGVGFDLRVGGDAFYGWDKQNRIGAGAGAGFGGNYFDGWFTLNYDRVLVTDDTFNVMLGGGVGFGSVKWDGDEELPGGENESLKMSYYPLKVRLAAQFLDKTRAYGAGIFLQDAVPARTVYTDLDGEYQESVGSIGNFALNFMVGAELSLQFGDFTPPKKGKKGKKGKGGGGGGGARDGDGARDGGGTRDGVRDGGGTRDGGGGGKRKGGGGGGKDGPGAHP